MKKHVTITGGTGFVGGYLTRFLAGKGMHVHVLTRNPSKYSDESNITYHAYEETDELVAASYAIVNLAGENLFDQRWSDELKKRIMASRVETTRSIVEAIAKAENKPSVLISASASGYYGSQGNKDLTEDEPAGDDFLANVCIQWEAEAEKVKSHGVRLVKPRIGIVIEKDGGALEKMLTPFKLFAGGPLGDGSQYFPWIHMDDICAGIYYAIEHDQMSGAYNFAAPQPLTMKEFASALGDVMSRPSWFPVPQFVLNLLLGEAGEAITASMKIIPKRLQEAGYKFKHTDVKESLKKTLN